MRRRIEFWNALVDIEQEHIARTREILSVARIDDHIAKLRAEIPELRSHIQAARKPGSGIAAADVRDLRSRLELLRASLRAAILEAKQNRPNIVPERRGALSVLDEQRRVAVKGGTREITSVLEQRRRDHRIV